MKLEGVAAVVTGGASGLGEATARALAAQGVKVALFDLNEARGSQVASEIGGVFCAVDVTDDASGDAGFEKARAAHGQERILVNCAGTGNAIKTASRDRNTGEVRHFPLDSFDRIIQITLVGTFAPLPSRPRGCSHWCRWRMARAGPSLTLPRSRPRMARWARRPIRRRRAAWWA